MASSSSSEHVMRGDVAKERAYEPDVRAMHPLAAEEWLGSHILAALADPRAVCKLALINKNFCSASRSDQVWQMLLPPPSHLKSLLKECDDDDEMLQYVTAGPKKDLYFHLCKSISLGAGGLKKFWLDQKTGGECYMLSARALSITWGENSQYWAWIPCSGAWFPEVAYLRNVCWFDISGKFQQLLKPGSYVVSFRMQVRGLTSFWEWSPIKLSLKNLTNAQPPINSRAFFHRRLPTSQPPLTVPPTPAASQPLADDFEHIDSDRYRWVDCDVGEFTVEEDEDIPVELEFSMREVEELNWKSGFLLDGVLIRPSNVVNAQDRPMVTMNSLRGYEGGDDEDLNAVETDFDESNEGREVEDNGGDGDDDDENVDDDVEFFDDNVEASDDDDDGGHTDSRDHSDKD